MIRACVDYLMDAPVRKDVPYYTPEVEPDVSINTGVTPKLPNWVSRIFVNEVEGETDWLCDILFRKDLKQKAILEQAGALPDQRGIRIPQGDREALAALIAEWLPRLWEWDVKKRIAELGLTGTTPKATRAPASAPPKPAPPKSPQAPDDDDWGMDVLEEEFGDRMFMLDAESLAEGGIAEALAEVYEEHEDKFKGALECEEVWGDEEESYSLEWGKHRFEVYGPSDPESHEKSWERATVAAFSVLNTYVKKPWKVYAVGGGEDLWGIFLTPQEHARILANPEYPDKPTLHQAS